jgi:plasmid stability protein
MAALTIRNLPDEVHAKLRVRAARAGRSMEAEARAILADACAAEADESATIALTLGLPTWVDQLFGERKPTGLVDELIAERRAEAARE